MLPEAFRAAGSPSFHDFLARQAPDLLPGAAANRHGDMAAIAPHGTTIVAATFSGGVVMAGDRRATMGNVIAQRDIEKVFPADEFSCIGIAGTAGLAIELVRLFQVELEHYEKIEGITLSADGKANRLASLIRNNLGLAMQGLAVVPRCRAAPGSSSPFIHTVLQPPSISAGYASPLSRGLFSTLLVLVSFRT